MNEGNRCPVCQARFRDSAECSRCGADLSRPMAVAARAWKLREEARMAIAAGDFERARDRAGAAQAAQRTEAGAALQILGGWLHAHAHDMQARIAANGNSRASIAPSIGSPT